MKRISTLLAMAAATLSMMAQGWPEAYGGVMLQGFYWDSYKDSQWTRLEKQADDLSKVFDLVWIPQSGYCGSQSMGYDDLYWFPGHYDSSFGTEQELRSLIQTYKDKGIGTIADVVINHRRNMSSWVDFPKEEYNGETYEMTSTDICANDDGGDTKAWATKNGYSLSQNNDTGEGWDGMRDLDHKSENVQLIVKAYLKMLLNDLGYAGFRYDMVKGYGAEFTKLYNQDAKPRFSVGEYWDGNAATVKKWIDGTGKTSAAFDFPFRYTVRNALRGSSNDNNSNNWKQAPDLKLLGSSSLASDADYRRYAVTFVENHDTEYRSAQAQQDPIRKDTLAANAFLLAMPGTPCVFLKHWQAYKQEIANMVTVRKAVGITNTSNSLNMATTSDYYVVQVTGTNGKLLAVVGTGAGSYTPTSAVWQKAISGYHYAYYVSDIDPGSISYPEMAEDEPEPDGKYNGVPSMCVMAEGEQCAFFEAPVSWGSQIFVWAWMNGGDGKNYLGADWPGVSATKLGTADNGNSVWKWAVTGTTLPDNIIFSGGGQQTSDLKFTNGGYYNEDGLQAVVSPTAIQTIDAGRTITLDVYRLDGSRVRTDGRTDGLPKGIYVIGGRKVVKN